MRREIFDQYGMNFLTPTVVEWVDVFTRKECKDIIIESLKYCQEKKGLIVYSYVVMSNHLHLVVQAAEGSTGLSNIMRDFKKFTSKRIVEFIQTSGKESRKEWLLYRFKYNAIKNGGNRQYQVWQDGSHPTALSTPKYVWRKINYIHQNPVGGWVREAEDYIYSSASNYAKDEGILDVEIYDEIVFM